MSKITFTVFCLFAFLHVGKVLTAESRPYQAPPLGSYQQAPTADSEEFKNIQIEEKLGQKIDTSLGFTDENNQPVQLSQYFSTHKPVIMVMAYYECPSLCGLLLNGVVESIRRQDLSIGKDFEFVVVSIDHEEDAKLAGWKKESYLKDYGRPVAAEGWHFLTGSKENIKKLTEELGFGYRYVEETGEYAHSAGFFVLTPEAKISRVHFGVQFEPRDVRLSLVEAADGKIGSFADKVLLFCFRYDPNSKGYALHAFRLVQAGGALTALLLGIYLFIFWRRQTRSAERDL